MLQQVCNSLIVSLKQKSKEKVCINQQVKNLEPGKFSINVP